MALWLVMAVQAIAVPSEIGRVEPERPLAPLTLTAPRCGNGGDLDEIVVCGGGGDRYRLPLPAERDASPGPVRGEAPSGMAALTPPGRCGLFAGERRCSKREAADYGYGDGRDRITFLTRLAQKVADPDAE